jgi:hypothetical protein
MDIVEAAGEPSRVAVKGTSGQPGRAGAPVPGHHPVVQREPKRRQLLVVHRERRQTLECVPQVVPEEAGEPAGKGRSPIGQGCPLKASKQPARHGERIWARGRRLQDRDRIRREVRPAGVAARPGTLEQAHPGQIAERLRDVDRARRRDRSGQLPGADEG